MLRLQLNREMLSDEPPSIVHLILTDPISPSIHSHSACQHSTLPPTSYSDPQKSEIQHVNGQLVRSTGQFEGVLDKNWGLIQTIDVKCYFK